MDFYYRLGKLKKEKNYTYEILGKNIGMSKDAFKQAFYRKSLSDLEKRELNKVYDLKCPEYVIQYDDEILHNKIKEFSSFFVQYEGECLQDPTINNIIEKRVAKRLVEITRNEDEIKKFLNS